MDASPYSRRLSAGDILFREGEDADCAYILETGRLEISTLNGGRKVVIAELEGGNIVGEMAVIDGAPRTATACAIEECRLMVITREQLTERLGAADPILKFLIRILLSRYRTGLGSIKGATSNDPPLEKLLEDEVGTVPLGIDKMRLENDLKAALRSESLQVFYQPMLNLRTGRITGFEALVRWNHPTRGPLSPELFIGLAEETSLIVPVGLYVFRKACADLHAFGEPGNADVDAFMSINVSARQIADDEFLSEAVRQVDACGMSPARIKLEITESLAAEPLAIAQWIDAAHGHGFRVALDDFGTGYSALSNLYRLPFDTIKIDRAFVTPLAEEASARELLKGIVDMAHGLGFEVVVEGIEDRPQLDYCRDLQCDLAQGYLIGKSVTAREAALLLGNSM